MILSYLNCFLLCLLINRFKLKLIETKITVAAGSDNIIIVIGFRVRGSYNWIVKQTQL